MSLVEEVTVVAAKFNSFKNTITIFIFLNQRQNLGIIIAIFVIISIIIIIIILAIMQLRPCENWDCASQWLFLNSSSLQYPHTNSPDWSEYISSKNKLREFDKRSKHLGQPLYTSERILLCVYFHLPSGVAAHKCIPVKWDFKVWWLSTWLQSLFLFSFYNYFITVF